MVSSNRYTIDLNSEENEILLNPRWPKKDYDQLYALAKKVQEERKLKSHVWISTSGSTAESIAGTKLVAISKQALRNSAISVNHHLQSDSSDIWAQVLPTFHVGGLGIEIRAALSGAKVVSALKTGENNSEPNFPRQSMEFSKGYRLSDRSNSNIEQRWDATQFCKVISKEKCTLSALVPAQVYDLVSKSLRAPASMRAIVVGGGAFEPELYNKARDLGWPLLPSYGMTETASQIATASLDSLKSLNEFPEVRLLSHVQAARNDDGFLRVKSTSLFTCYAQNTFQGIRHWDPKVDGWFTSEDKGDVVCRNSSGDVLVIEGRSKDYVKIGGEGTNLARLRSVLENCCLAVQPEWATKLALLDIPSERLGSEIHLVSLLSDEETTKVISRYAEKVLPFEKIRKIYYLNEIPRSDLGKILWGELRCKLQNIE